MLFFAWNATRNVSQTFEDLKAKRSVMIQCVRGTHPLLYGACTLTIVHSVFSIMAGLIVEMLFSCL